MARPVRVMMWIAFPVAWPIAKLLEYILGAHHGIIYRRSELRELIKMHAAGGEGGGDLDKDTVTMAQGALDLAQKSVKEAMTAIDQVFVSGLSASNWGVEADREGRCSRLRPSWITRRWVMSFGPDIREYL